MRFPKKVELEGGGLFISTSEGGKILIVPFRKGGDVNKSITTSVGWPLYGTVIMVDKLIEALEASKDKISEGEPYGHR